MVTSGLVIISGNVWTFKRALVSEPRLCDEDVHLTSKKSRRPSTREQSTRGEVDQSEGSTIS